MTEGILVEKSLDPKIGRGELKSKYGIDIKLKRKTNTEVNLDDPEKYCSRIVAMKADANTKNGRCKRLAQGCQASRLLYSNPIRIRAER